MSTHINFHTSSETERVQVKATAYSHDTLWVGVKMPSSYKPGPLVEFTIFADDPKFFEEVGRQIIEAARSVEAEHRRLLREHREEQNKREDTIAEMARTNREALRKAQTEESDDE